MIGGDEDIVQAAHPLFDIMGAKIVHCGSSGAGQAAKICNNMILGITMIGTCEAFALADKLGLDRQSLYDVVSGASGQSWSMTSYCPAPGIGPNTPSLVQIRKWVPLPQNYIAALSKRLMGVVKISQLC